MIEKTYYIENSFALDTIYNHIVDSFPCFCDRELIEMNHSMIVIKARIEDLDSYWNSFIFILKR